MTKSSFDAKKSPVYYIWYVLTVILTVGIDQITKYFAVKELKPIDTYPIINGVLHLTYVENTGAAFGMMKDSRWIFMTVSTVAIVAIAVVIFKYGRESVFSSFCLSMILGGGIGNMIDRIALGYVVDFVDFRLINFAVFNGADSFVCVGAFLMIIYLALELVRETKAEKAAKENATEVTDTDPDRENSEEKSISEDKHGEDE